MAKLLCLDTTMGLRTVNCDDLQDYYDNLECDTFDIARRQIGGKYFDIFVDDCGLFVDKPIISAISKDLNPMLVGNLIFANHDGQGNTTSLSEADMRLIANNVVLATINGDPYFVVVCEY